MFKKKEEEEEEENGEETYDYYYEEGEEERRRNKESPDDGRYVRVSRIPDELLEIDIISGSNARPMTTAKKEGIPAATRALPW